MARTDHSAERRRSTDQPPFIDHTMRPNFDIRDASMLAERQAARDALGAVATLPLVGDLVDMPDGTTRRVTRVGSTTIQLTQPDLDASFYLGASGLCDFSGALDFGHPIAAFTRDDRSTAPVWFFHHGEVRAHNGVHCVVTVTRWKRVA